MVREKKATIRDVARIARVSISTISRYLNNENILDELRERIEAAIAELNYKPNRIASSLKSHRTNTVGLLIPSFADPFCGSLTSGVELELEKLGYALIVSEYHENAQNFAAKCGLLLDRYVDGLIVIPDMSVTRELLEGLNIRVPMVFLDNLVPEWEHSDAVMLDNRKAAREAVDYLIENGHTNVMLLSDAAQNYTSREREEGYFESLAAHGIPRNPDYVRRAASVASQLEDIADKLEGIDSAITAVFSTNFYLTMGAIFELNRSGRKYPDDISVVGFDDLFITSLANPKLTIVSQPMEELGAQAARLIVRKTQGDASEARMHLVEGRLVLGCSVKNLNRERMISDALCREAGCSEDVAGH